MALCKHVLLNLFLVLSATNEVALGLRVKGRFSKSSEDSTSAHYLAKFGVMKGAQVFMFGHASPITDKNSTFLVVFTSSSSYDDIGHLSCNSSVLEYACSSCHYTSVVQLVSSSEVSICPQTCNRLFGTQVLLSNDSVPHTEYWYAYLFFCSCTSGVDCQWQHSAYSFDFNYQFYIVNDAPNNSNHDPFTYQFPANEQGLLITYMIFALIYLLLVPVHFAMHSKYTIKCRTPVLICLFHFALIFEAAHITCGLIHYAVYSGDGYGAPPLNYLKEFFNLVGDWFLILVLILIAGGWMVTIRTIKWKAASFSFIGAYITLTLIYYICSVVYPEIYPWMTKHPLQTWGGGIYLAGRGLLLFYVWYQIYHIHRQEEKLQKLRLYRILFVIFSAWFWYLPLATIIVSLINPVISWVVLINFMNTMNFLVNLLMVFLFCPLWSHEYFQFDHIMNSLHSPSQQLMGSLPTKQYYSKIRDGEGGTPSVL